MYPSVSGPEARVYSCCLEILCLDEPATTYDLYLSVTLTFSMWVCLFFTSKVV